MANSTQEAILLAAEGIAKLKLEMTGLNTVILEGATNLNKMLSADKASFKEINELILKVNTSTVKLNESSQKKIVIDGKIKVKQNELAKTYQALNAQREKEIKQRERQVEKVSQLNQKLAKTKKLQDAVSSKAMTGRMIESVNAIGKTNDGLKKLNAEYRELEKESNKAIKLANKEKIARDKLSGAYTKLVAQQQKAKKVLQDLIVSQGKNSRETKKAQRAYNGLTKRVNQANQATSHFAKKGLMSATRGVRSLMGAFGLVGGVYLFANAIRNTFNRVREFDKSMQNLAGVFRVTRDDLKPLEATIVAVAGESVKTSREVATLAETLATLGKTPEQIQKLLKPVVDLGIGLDVTSDAAGEFLIQMMNAFGAGDDEALKYADTIATIRTSTTLDFQKMRDSFQYIAPISRLLNKDLAYTGALVGIIADNGLKAQQAGRVLGTSLQKLAIQGLTLNDALELISDAQKSGVKETELLAMANKLMGAEGAKLGVILARNTGLIEENAQAVRDNSGALEDLVNEQLKSVDAKLLVLDATWEELILTIENGQGSLSKAFVGFIETITFAIQRTIELQKAQSDLFKMDVEESGWRRFFDNIIPGLGLISTAYEDATKAQIKFNKENESLAENGLSQLLLMYNNLENEIVNNKSLSDEIIKVYENQLDVIKDIITAKDLEKIALEETAVQMGFNTSAMGELVDVSTLSIYQLKEWIKANEEISGVIDTVTSKERTMAIVLAEKAVLQKELTNSTKEEAGAILSKIAILDKELKAWEKLKDAKSGKRDKAEGIELPKIKGGTNELSKYQKELLKVLDHHKKLEVVPELLPLNPETQKRIDAYKKSLADTIVELSKLEDLKGVFLEVTDTFSDMFDIDMSKFDFLFDGAKNSVEDWAKLSKELIGSVLDASLQSYDIELQTAQRNRDLILNNDLATEEQKEASRKKFDAKEREINIKKAKQERQNNLIKIAMDTAVAIVKSVAASPLTGGMPFSAIALGIGLTQAAIVASQPLPQFEKGTQDAPKGMAITDEKGAELHTDKFGNIKDFGSNKGARQKFLNKGDKIFTADKTNELLGGFGIDNLQQAIFDMNMHSNGNILSDNVVDKALLNQIGGLREDIDKMGLRIVKIASRPINVNNKVEIKQDKAY